MKFQALITFQTVAESELLKASAEVSRTMKGLEEQMLVFEKKKLEDVKSSLHLYYNCTSEE